MANSITDNRTPVDAADSVTPYDNLAGSSAGTLDTDVFIQGSGAIGGILSDSRDGILYDAGSAQNWSNNVFYIWINCGIVGLLDTKAAGGFTIRFCGNTVTDWFEFYVGGSDSWPAAVSGGWVQFVVDIEGTPDNTNGTPPATSAIRYVGWSGITASVMPKMVDNTWIDEIRRLPDGNPGIIVQGRNGGVTDWTWGDLPSELGAGVGTAKIGAGGAVVLNTPVQFFVDDATTHAFTDTNSIVLWEDQEFAPSDLYGITILGAATGTANFTLGVKTGSGDNATGAQGSIIAASATGVRWFLDADTANIDACNLHGCSFIHGGDFQLDAASTSLISTFLVDCSSATFNNAEVVRLTVINANTADGVAFATSDDPGDFSNSVFEFSDGHAIELTATGTFSMDRNTFTGYGADGSNDAAIYNNSGGAVTINVTNGTTPTVRNGAGASTTVNAAVNLNITVVDKDANPIENVRVGIFDATDNTQYMNELTNASGFATETYTDVTPNPVIIVLRKSSSADNPRYFPVRTPATIAAGTGLTVTLSMVADEIAA